MGRRKLTEHAARAVVVVLALMFEVAAASPAFAYGPPSATQTGLLGVLVLVNLAAFGWYAAGRRPRISPVPAAPPPSSPPTSGLAAGAVTIRDVALILVLSLPLWAFGGALIAECWALWFHGGYVHLPPLVSRLLVLPFLLAGAASLCIAVFLTRLGLRSLKSILTHAPASGPRVGQPQTPLRKVPSVEKPPSRATPNLWTGRDSAAGGYVAAIMCAVLGFCGAWFFWRLLEVLFQDQRKHLPYSDLLLLLPMLGVCVVGLLAAALFIARETRRR